MAIAPNHWSSMDLKRLQMSLTDLSENQISMFSDFCHVVEFLMQNYNRYNFPAIPKSVQMRLGMKTYTFGYGTAMVITLLLQCKINNEYDKQGKRPDCRLPNCSRWSG